MANYRGLKGFKVESLSSDPATSGIASGSWASGGNMNTSRGYVKGFGTQTAAMATGGSGPSTWLLTEEYNGTAWSEESADLNTGAKGRGHHGFLQTAGLIYGGEDAPTTVTGATESYDGSSWTELNDLNNARKYLAGAGSTTANLAFGGFPPAKAECESWDGSSWTEVADLNSAAYSLVGAGSQTAAIRCGGVPGTQLVETWDGSTWTETTDFSNARSNGSMSGGQPSNTSQLLFGGSPSPSVGTLVEWWDGAAWSEVPAMSNAREDSAGAGTDISALAGDDDSPGVQTEEFTSGDSYSNRIPGQLYFNTTSSVLKYIADPTAPAGTWASGGNLNTGRYNAGGAGTQTAGLLFGGAPGTTADTEKYDGSAWTEVNNLNTARNAMSRAGTQTAALCIGGPPEQQFVESFDGTSWTEITDLNSAKANACGGGLQTAAIVYGGPQPTPGSVNTEVWNGSAWTEVNNLNTAVTIGSGDGTTTSAMCAGGVRGGSADSALTENYDGSTWTEVGDLNQGRNEGGGAGDTSAYLCMGGAYPAAPASGYANIVESWDGSSWTEISDYASARSPYNAGAGTTTAGIVMGGQGAAPTAVMTEEFSVPSTATLKTVTGS